MRIHITNTEANPYHVTSEIISQIVRQVYKNYNPGDLIVNLGIKYSENESYEYINTILFANEWLGYDEWYDDWYEGQKYIDINAFIPVHDICHWAYQIDDDGKTIVSKSEWINPTYGITVWGKDYDVVD